MSCISADCSTAPSLSVPSISKHVEKYPIRGSATRAGIVSPGGGAAEMDTWSVTDESPSRETTRSSSRLFGWALTCGGGRSRH